MPALRALDPADDCSPEVGRYLAALDRGLGEVKVRARRVPPDRTRVKLAPDVRSAVELLLHVGEIESKWLVQGVGQRATKFPPPTVPSFDALFAHLDAVRSESTTVLKALTDADLEAVREVPEKGPTTIRRALMDLLEHQAHHGGQLGMLARLLKAQGAAR